MDVISHQGWDRRVLRGHFGHQQGKQQTQHQHNWPGRKCVCFADSFCSCLVQRDRAMQKCWGLEINVFFWVLSTVCAAELQEITATRTGSEWKCGRTVQESGGELCVWLCGNASVTGGFPAEETGGCVLTPNIPCCFFLTPVAICECLISPVCYTVSQGDNISFSFKYGWIPDEICYVCIKEFGG